MAEAEFTQHESHVARDVPLYVAVARSKSRQQSRAVRESGQRRRRLAGLLIGAFAAGAGISLLTEPDRAFEFRELPALLGSAPWQSSPAQATVVKNNQTAAPVAASALPPPAAITVAHPAAPEQKRLTPPAVLPETHAPDENVTTTAYTSPAPKLTEEKTETLPAPPAAAPVEEAAAKAASAAIPEAIATPPSPQPAAAVAQQAPEPPAIAQAAQTNATIAAEPEPSALVTSAAPDETAQPQPPVNTDEPKPKRDFFDRVLGFVHF